MEKIILKSEKTGEELFLTFGLAVSQAKISSDMQVKLLVGQADENVTKLTKHFTSHQGDKLSYVSVKSID